MNTGTNDRKKQGSPTGGPRVDPVGRLRGSVTPGIGPDVSTSSLVVTRHP